MLHLTEESKFKWDNEDEITNGSLLIKEGNILQDYLKDINSLKEVNLKLKTMEIILSFINDNIEMIYVIILSIITWNTSHRKCSSSTTYSSHEWSKCNSWCCYYWSYNNYG